MRKLSVEHRYEASSPLPDSVPIRIPTWHSETIL